MGIESSLLTPVNVTDSCRPPPWHRDIKASRGGSLRRRARLRVEVASGVEASPADVGHRDVTRFDRPCPCAPQGDRFFRTYPCPAQETTYTENRHVFSLTGRALSFYMFCSLSSAGFSGT